MRIRPARTSEAAELTHLALRSKSYWGYDATFIEACRIPLKITPEKISEYQIWVAEINDRIAGLYGLSSIGNGADLEYMFVEPEFIGRGVGRRLWKHAICRCYQRGFQHLSIESDPHAEGFYIKMGAKRMGNAPSDVVAGRNLPLLVFTLTKGNESSQPSLS